MHVFRDSWIAAGRNLELNPGEMRALEALADNGPQPMGALARTLQCDASNVTWLADRLESRGFVERRTDVGDRRVKTLALTDAGRDAQRQAHEQWRTPPDPLLARPDDEVLGTGARPRRLTHRSCRCTRR